ncbi:hypothetical protein ACFLQN_01215 [Candidatus Aenigmatarchaeota archaeon]
MKGITPIIAIILLLVIVIVVTASAFTIFQGVITSSGETAQTQVEQQSERLSKCLRIESVSSDGIYVRNCGQGIVTDIKVYLGNEEIPSDNMNITEDGIAKINVSFGPHPGEGTNQLRVASSSATAFPRTVTISGLQTIELDYNDILEDGDVINSGFKAGIGPGTMKLQSIGATVARSYIDFHTSSLPSNAVITQANISLEITSVVESEDRDIEFRKLTPKGSNWGDGMDAENLYLYNNISAGDLYTSEPWNAAWVIGDRINITLGNTATTEMTKAISQGWFSLGIKFFDDDPPVGLNDRISFHTEETTNPEDDAPRLVVTYYRIS